MSQKALTNSEMLLYQTEDGQSRIQVRLEGETVWMTQKLMAELFQVAVPTINEHLKNFFSDGELAEGAVIRKFRIAADDGKQYLTNHYNLDAFLAFNEQEACRTQAGYPWKWPGSWPWVRTRSTAPTDARWRRPRPTKKTPSSKLWLNALSRTPQGVAMNSTGRHKPYPGYTNSGMEWLGDVPAERKANDLIMALTGWRV